MKFRKTSGEINKAEAIRTISSYFRNYQNYLPILSANHAPVKPPTTPPMINTDTINDHSVSNSSSDK